MASPKPPSVTEIMDVHRRIVEEYDTYRGTRHPNPEAVLANIVDKAAKAESPTHAAAELFDGIIRTHVFEDGNKRTATVVAVDYLQRADIDPPEPSAFVPLAKHRARFDIDAIAHFFETHELDDSKLR